MASKSKGQSSLEFLMTYGWVLLIILIVLVVMWQWGLFSLSQRIEPGSFGFWGVLIQQGNEFILDENGQLRVSFINNVGANITILTCNATIDRVSIQEDCGASGCGYDDPRDCVIQPGKKKIITMQDSTDWVNSAGNRFEASMVLRYSDDRTGANTHQSSGKIWGTVEL